jgi:phage terminase large subunit GpA-like protein
MAINGTAKAIVPLGNPTKFDINQRGAKIKRGVKLWPVGVSLLKSEFYNTLKLQREMRDFRQDMLIPRCTILSISNN